MGIPQVPEQVRRAPILALRAVFAGIGRILMSADRAEAGHAGALAGRGGLEQRRLAEHKQRTSATALEEPGPRWRSLDQTGNVRLLSADADRGRDLPVTADVPGAAGPAANLAASTPALPLASYDALSLASIRARLRGLDVGQLKVLLDYEATHAERPEFIGMFERRIEKLESGQ
jgi:hypothetical protein